MAAGLNLAKLITSDNPTDDRRHPIIIGCNQSSRAVVQLQCRISQCIGNAMLRELWAYGTNNYPLWLSTMGCGTEVGVLIQIVNFHQGNTGGVVYAAHDRGVATRWQVCDDC